MSKGTLKSYMNTKVSVSNTQEAIRKLFKTHGVLGCQFAELWDDSGNTTEIQVKFLKEVSGQKHTISISIPLARNIKQTWRALYWWLKTQMEAVEAGLMSVEQAFLAHFEWMLGSGELMTLGDAIIPQLGEPGVPQLEAPAEVEEEETEEPEEAETVEGEFKEV